LCHAHPQLRSGEVAKTLAVRPEAYAAWFALWICTVLIPGSGRRRAGWGSRGGARGRGTPFKHLCQSVERFRVQDACALTTFQPAGSGPGLWRPSMSLPRTLYSGFTVGSARTSHASSTERHRDSTLERPETRAIASVSAAQRGRPHQHIHHLDGWKRPSCDNSAIASASALGQCGYAVSVERMAGSRRQPTLAAVRPPTLLLHRAVGAL